MQCVNTCSNTGADTAGSTPLWIATRYGHDECLTVLLDEASPKDVNVEHLNDHGVSPLLAACFYVAVFMGQGGQYGGTADFITVNETTDVAASTAASTNAGGGGGGGGGGTITDPQFTQRDRNSDTQRRPTFTPARQPIAFDANPARSLVILLESRRIPCPAIARAAATLREQLLDDEHGGKTVKRRTPPGGQPMLGEMAAYLLPVLDAHVHGRRRWCAWCLRVTPRRDLETCPRCHQVG